jgi:FAD/FMN-containing dehydrogenase
MYVMAFSDSSLPPVSPQDAEPLAATVAGSVLLPGDAGYDDERAVWNLNHELAPAVIVVAQSAADIQAAVTFAAGQHRPVLVKATGHQIVGQAHGAVVIATRRMNDVTIDALGRTARVGPGVIWSEVIEKAAEAGLAPVSGSNPTVGVVGYTLGGGLSPTLGRSHGYAADHVRSLDLVTADGELRHVDAESEPDLFWALRGGKGNFGVVTALEFDLFPVPRLYGGAIYFPGERMADVLRAWTDWLPSTPETMTSSFAVLRLPALPELPEPLRGAFTVALRIAYTGTSEDGERMIAPLRAVAPAVLDTVADMPYTAVASIHNEPTEPVPFYERSITLRELPARAQDKLVELVGPDSQTSSLWITELRALGGAWDREPAAPNAVATRGLPYVLLGVAVGPLSEEPQLKRSVADLLDGLEPWQGDRRVVNNLAPDEAADAEAIYGPERYARLASIKKAYDPANMFRLNHNVAPAA